MNGESNGAKKPIEIMTAQRNVDKSAEVEKVAGDAPDLATVAKDVKVLAEVVSQLIKGVAEVMTRVHGPAHVRLWLDEIEKVDKGR